MPYISTKTSTTISRKQEVELKERLGKAITLIPGKTEKGLMLSFEPEMKMYIRGDNLSPIAFIDARFKGEQSREAVDRLTEELTKIHSEVLSIPTENIYITYQYVNDWGCNGKNL